MFNKRKREFTSDDIKLMEIKVQNLKEDLAKDLIEVDESEILRSFREKLNRNRQREIEYGEYIIEKMKDGGYEKNQEFEHRYKVFNEAYQNREDFIKLNKANKEQLKKD